MRVVSRLSAGVRGKNRGQAFGQECLASARGTKHQSIVGAGRRDQEGAFGIVSSLDVDEVILGMRELAKNLVEIDRLRIHVHLPGQKANRLGQTADRIDI